MKPTATLKNAIYAENFGTGHYGGEVYGDIHKRWPDGTFIWTSKVKSVSDNLVKTLNSVYAVEMRR